MCSSDLDVANSDEKRGVKNAGKSDSKIDAPVLNCVCRRRKFASSHVPKEPQFAGYGKVPTARIKSPGLLFLPGYLCLRVEESHEVKFSERRGSHWFCKLLLKKPTWRSSPQRQLSDLGME